MYRHQHGVLELLLAHPGGPFFARKDAGTWTIPKGEPAPGEDLRVAAVREFREEVGLTVNEPLLPLGEIRQKGGKIVHAWAFAGDAVASPFVPPSNTFALEWPPRSGRQQSFPEIDRVELFTVAGAQGKLNPAQLPSVQRLQSLLAGLR